MDFGLLLDFEKPFNVALLDTVVDAFYEGDVVRRSEAQNVLAKLQSRPESWKLVAQILEQTSNLRSKFIGLSILENFVVVRWNTLSKEERLGIRNYIAALVVEVPASRDLKALQKVYLNKLNMVLVQIVKKEWPQHWPNFISEIVALGKTNMNLCENNMKILKLLSEEIFDFSEDHMIQAKMQKLKKQMKSEFGSIIDLCQQVLSNETDELLIVATLETLLRFLSWIPINVIFDTGLLDSIQRWLFGPSTQRNLALQCCSEIAGQDIPEQYYQKLVKLYQSSVQCSTSRLDIVANYEAVDTEDQALVQDLALFITAIFKKRLDLVGGVFSTSQALEAHLFLLKISHISGREIWKICLEYWAILVGDLVREAEENDLQQRNMIYAGVLTGLRFTLIDQMVKPDEVLVVQDEEGETIWEFNRQSDTSSLYQTMRHVLQQLTRLDVMDTEAVIQKKLANETGISGGAWSWSNLSKLCWAVGCISLAMNEPIETRFLTDISQKLIKMQNETSSKDQEFVITSSLTYIASQNPRFLAAQTDFRGFILDKLYRCMHDPYKGVQEMAADAFLKICRANLKIFDSSMLTQIDSLSSDLDLVQICIVYEAMSHIILAAPEPEQPRLVGILMNTPNKDLSSAFQMCHANPQLLATPEMLKALSSVVKKNIAVCRALATSFQPQLQRIAQDIIVTYKQLCALAKDHQVEHAKSPTMQLLLRLKEDILVLIDTFVTTCERLDASHQPILTEFLTVFMTDYRNNAQKINAGSAAEVGVSTVITHIIEKLGKDNSWPGLLEATLEMILQPTLPLITHDFSEYPEQRRQLYVLLEAINRNCFAALFQLPKKSFTLWVDTILWGTKHPTPDISQVALQTCLDMIEQIREHPDEDVASEFYQAYYLHILHDILAILTDPDLQNAFERQSQVLALMLQLVQEGEIYTRLYDPSQVDNTHMSNAEFLQDHVRQLMCTAFPLLQKNQIEAMVLGMFEYSEDLPRFQHDLRDFLIDIRQIGEDEGDIKREEKEAELELLRYL